MLKLSNFPRGSNRNRPLKLRAIALEQEDDPHSMQETRRLFRRFWREFGYSRPAARSAADGMQGT